MKVAKIDDMEQQEDGLIKLNESADGRRNSELINLA